jgi:multidrug efflux pump subunit AcrA (membrane-fusion protein)
MEAKVTLANAELVGKVSSLASVARPAGWWTGNVVKYDVIVEVPPLEDLKPGMTAEVDLLLASYDDVLTIPVAAVIQTEDGYFCWVKRGDEFVKKPILLGDGNDIFIVVEQGLETGDEVALSPQAIMADQGEVPAATQSAGPASTESGPVVYEPDDVNSGEVQGE